MAGSRSISKNNYFLRLCMFKVFGIARSCLLAAILISASVPANAGGWATVHRHVHKTGKCGVAREVLASHYRVGTITASGEKFDPYGLTAASHDYPLGTIIKALNPLNGRTCSVRINDRGPYGTARQMGAKIDFALGAANCLGMRSAQYVCAPQSVEPITKPKTIAPVATR